MVGAVVDDQDEGPDPVGVGRPAEHHQGDRCVVVDEHLPKVLSPHVKKLAETIGDQRRRHEPLFIDRIFNEANIHSLRQELDTLLKLAEVENVTDMTDISV